MELVVRFDASTDRAAAFALSEKFLAGAKNIKRNGLHSVSSWGVSHPVTAENAQDVMDAVSNILDRPALVTIKGSEIVVTPEELVF